MWQMPAPAGMWGGGEEEGGGAATHRASQGCITTPREALCKRLHASSQLLTLQMRQSPWCAKVADGSVTLVG